MNCIPVSLVVEDYLSEAVLRRMLREINRSYIVGPCYGKAGFGYIRKKINGFNNAAKGSVFIVVADLDNDECAPGRIDAWLRAPMHPNLVFRIAVREIESWILADITGIARYLGVSSKRIPNRVDELPDPKQYLVNLARRSRSSSIKADVVPWPCSTAQVGRNYNGRLVDFVVNHWDISAARENSDSLKSAIDRLNGFSPTDPTGITC